MEPRLGQWTGDEEAPPRPAEPEPSKRAIWWVALILVLAGGAAYYYWQYSAQRPPEPAPLTPPQAEALPQPPTVSAEPAIRYPVEAATTEPLPALDASDAAMRQALAGLVGEKSLVALFYPDKLIRRIVATVDNLPRKKAPRNIMPVKPANGAFETAGKGENVVISPDNARRYAPFVSLAQAVDARKLASAYVRLYPLFQRAYEELGHPGRYFNDRLVEALDDLLAAPEVSGPVKLIQQKVLYQYADPSLEARSAGQKIMMRMGNENAATVKAKLREIRREVTAIRRS